jgi:hypothetical protein
MACRGTDLLFTYFYLPSASEIELAIRKLKSSKSSGSDHIPAKLVQAWRGILNSEIGLHKRITRMLI